MFSEHPLGYSFFLPPPEVEFAADLVSTAADAHLRGDSEEARTKLQQADMDVLKEYRSCFVGRNKHPRVTQLRIQEFELVKVEAGNREKIRNPRGKEEERLFARDGWRCRYCSMRVVKPSTISHLSSFYPDEIRWHARPYSDRNVIFNIIAGSLDHVVPHAYGGGSGEDNLVTACGCCNYGKKANTLAQIGISDPRLRLPQIDGWDGLTRILKK